MDFRVIPLKAVSFLLAALWLPLAGQAEPAHLQVKRASPSYTAAPLEVNDVAGSLSAGYDTHYVFRGVERGKDSGWVQVEATIPETDLNLGLWYQNPFKASTLNPEKDPELQLWAVLNVELGPGTLSLGGIGYLTPGESRSGFRDRFELALEYSQPLGPVDVRFSAARDFTLAGWFFEAGLAKSIPLGDRVRLDASAGVSYQIDYFMEGAAPNHASVCVAMPVALTERVTLEPFVALAAPLEAIEWIQDDEIYGGVSVVVTF